MSFVLPDLFGDTSSFDEWYVLFSFLLCILLIASRFNLPTMQQSMGSNRSSQIVDALHAILKPFLLRRLKVDVETNLPPKKEYVLYAPLSVMQREAYDQVLNGTMRSYLIGATAMKDEEPKEILESEDGLMTLRSEGRKSVRKNYAVDGDDDEYFEMLHRGEVDERGVREIQAKADLAQLSKDHQRKSTRK